MPLNVFSGGATDVVVPSAARTVSGATASLPGYGGAKVLRCQLDVTAASGTGPTLDVVVQDTIDGVNFYTVGTFVQKVAAGREAINITVPFTETLRVSWAITGVTPSFTFAVVVYSEA